MGGRSYSPSPPRGGRYARRGRSPSPRGRYGGSSRGRDLPTSLLVRNLRLDCRPEDLRRPFGEFGPLKDVYLPRDYYSGEPRGFGFVQFVDPADAAEAKYQMDGGWWVGMFGGSRFWVESSCFLCGAGLGWAGGGGGSRYSDRRRSPPRRYSPPPRYARSRSRSREYSPPPKRRHQSRSVSPRGKKYSRERSYSRSPARARSPSYDGGSRSPSRSPIRDRSPPPESRSPSQSPEREKLSPTDRSPLRSPSRSRSPDPRDYARAKPKRDASLSP
ncbi:hypothetical protein M8C21_006069 [Ambrosia artemisiifolia]|uniref:RRM domain-containing protein n=1 Tax=Ambrosia artemisiifolia TaxID=4212 RepID=A0AAD5BR69_AMBAR|nr:hypothetical protein M8C21_006069 [Ambrosia artemisiifolia]